MKKLLLSLVVCLGLVSFASQTFAQSNALAPFNGATHNYTFQNIQANAEYEFFVTTENKFDATRVSSFGVFVGATDVEKGTIATGGGSATVDIQWDAAATGVAGGFYLFLKVYTPALDGTDCESANYKAVHIVPVANIFNIAIADIVTPDPSCPDLDVTFSPLVAVAGDGTNSGYVAGKTTLTYTVTPVNSALADEWSFQFDITAVNAPTSYTWSVNGVNGTQANISDIQSAIISGVSTNIVIVLDNQPGVSPSFTIHFDSARNETTETNATVSLPANLTHTVKVMPSIGDFVGI
ncbi:hypothetical protein ACXR6G_13880 [Ancylomarina sp. YFZ004]